MRTYRNEGENEDRVERINTGITWLLEETKKTDEILAVLSKKKNDPNNAKIKNFPCKGKENGHHKVGEWGQRALKDTARDMEIYLLSGFILAWRHAAWCLNGLVKICLVAIEQNPYCD